jgi:prepilin signal peptidase PulO-like enzyme (type II secretory pathway)
MLSLTACLSQVFLTLILLFSSFRPKQLVKHLQHQKKPSLTALPFAPSINSGLALSLSTNQPFILSFVEG